MRSVSFVIASLLQKLFITCLFVPGLVAFQLPAAAQSTMKCHAMAAQSNTQEAIPPEKLPVPQKMSGIGSVHLQIKATPEAQAWFDQGLNLFHDFWDYESAKAFEQSVRSDPNCAMCYWGLYQVADFYHSMNAAYAGQALSKAMSLRKHASKADRLYIEAAAAHEELVKADKNDFSKEVQVWRKLVKSYPKDTQARIFLAITVEDGYNDKGEPNPGQKEALAILQGVMKDEPQNSAANHYWIHGVEASPHPEQALHSAEILGTLAPASGHLVHMPGHIYYRTGDYARAEAAFAASTGVDERYMQSQHVAPDDDWNYVHNLMYAVANLLEEGKLKEADDLSAKTVGARGQLAGTLYTGSPRDSMSRLDPRLPGALRTADWPQVQQILQNSKPGENAPNLIFLASQLKHFSEGMQALENHDVAKAEASSSRLDAELWRVSQRVNDEDAAKTAEARKAEANSSKLQIMPDAMPKPLVSNLAIMSLELRAGIFLAKNQPAAAKKLFEEAAQEEKALGYREPPPYIRPVGETEGSALMTHSDWSGAKAAYRKALTERPRSGFPLYGIAMCEEKSGDSSAARKAYQDFLTAWKDANPDLPQVIHATAYLTNHEPAPAKN